MAERRRIVPDSSVVLEALFPGTLVGTGLVSIGPRAQTILNAIQGKSVVTFAPEQLIAEVLKGAYRICTDRSAKYLRLTREHAHAAVSDFLSWPIEFSSSEDLAPTALALVNDAHVSAPDSWFAACAMHRDAELWISHDQADGIVSLVRARHSKVFTLAERAFLPAQK